MKQETKQDSENCLVKQIPRNEVLETCNSTDKKLVRRLSLKIHPDKNQNVMNMLLNYSKSAQIYTIKPNKEKKNLNVTKEVGNGIINVIT